MLAIVVPYYKLTFFDATIQSLANQTDKRFKVYIGDDASLEDPSALLEKYQGKFEFMYHKFKNNLGSISLVKQWERCIALSKNEEWIMILGDDDVLGENVVEQFYANLPEFVNTSNVVRFATKILNEKTGTQSNFFLQPKFEMVADSYYRRFKGLTRSSLSEYVFSKDSYLKYGFQEYPLGWHSDDRAWFDFSENKPIFAINECIVFVRESAISITGKNDNKDLKNLAAMLFFKGCINQKMDLFKKGQRFEIMLAYETAIKNSRKLKRDEWLFLMKYYFKHFKFIPFLKFNRRFLISIFKK
ncbi:MAG: glycosyltransferase [Lutibacter sp.]